MINPFVPDPALKRVNNNKMLFVVFGADCDHVGDIYECPQGTYAIGRRAPLQNNFICTKTQTTKIFVIQTTNYS